ncbi:MAG TPA: type II secretion system protein [Candidatus Limnocylindrales bacterium]|nr:type II secretion system protein [Candidatus Limnocylindrales bacterium]
MAYEGTHRRGFGSKLLTLITLIIVVGLAAAAGTFFMRYRDVRTQLRDVQTQNSDLSKQLNAYKTDPGLAAQSEADKTVAEVGKVYALPKDEKPTILIVSDKEASKKQYGAFFDKAENNDISLIYTKAKVAILYRPSSKQIINVSSLTIEDTPARAPAAP